MKLVMILSGLLFGMGSFGSAARADDPQRACSCVDTDTKEKVLESSEAIQVQVKSEKSETPEKVSNSVGR